MNKRLIPVAAVAAVLCASLAVFKIQNPDQSTQDLTTQAQAAEEEPGAGAEGQEQTGGEEESGVGGEEESGEGAEGQEQAVGETEPQPGGNTGPQPGDGTQESQEPGLTYKPISVTETEEYTEKTVHVVRGTLEEDTSVIRFYKESPNVPYMGIGEYFDLMLGGGLKVQDNGDGTFAMTNAAGARALVDVGKGIVSAEDLPSFENYFDEAREGKASSFKDSTAPYLCLREVVYEEDPVPVRFDLGHLGITLHADTEEVWFPVSILSSWLSDIAQNRIVCNGECLYICRGKSAYEMDNGYFNTEYFDKILTGTEREEDLAAYSYADLGFIFQYMYGYPGRTELDPGILRNEGFDEALAALGENGQELREELSSKDFRDFWFGMYELSDGPMEDGHNSTSLSIGVVDASQTEKYREFREYIWSKFDDYELSDFVKKISEANNGVYSVRPEVLSVKKYYKHGDTAIILLDAFSVDEGAWREYYQNGGELPKDTMGVAAAGLMEAAEDGEVKNIVFDLSTNPGGYSDAVMGVLSLMTGRDYLCGYNELSEQHFKVYFDVDRNLDGEIDEKDDEVNYDFNYAVMTSGASFSCGNLFPFLVKDEGGMVIGDRSGGGSCSIQKAVLSEGFDINISGCKFKLTDESGSDLENGVTPDVQLEIGVRKEISEITGEEQVFPDYSSFGDLDGICEAVSGWFETN